MSKRYRWYAVLLFFLLIGSALTWADDDDDDKERKEKRFTAEIVRVADLGSGQLGPAFGPNGNDPLRKGKLELRGDRRVEVELRGAAASAVYAVFFCRFGFGPDACVNLGSLETNAEGNGETRVQFSAPTSTWAGVFIFTRNATNQFISGFGFEAAAQDGVQVELEGRISSLNASNQSFRLNNLPVDIFVGPSTRFEHLSGFGALSVGLKVEVKGFVQADGTILATKIEAEEKDDDD